MADNKNSVRRGLSRGDEEQLRRLPMAAKAQPARGETLEVPRSATKPGRAHDQAGEKNGPSQATRRAASPPHADTTIRGDTYESNDASGHTSHNNK